MSTVLPTGKPGRFAAIATSLFAGAIVLTACGSDGGATLSYEDSPLMEYLSVGYDATKTDEQWQAEAEARDLQMQEAIAACMTKQGFEYTPVSNSMYFSGSDLDVEWDSKAFAEKYGYGVFTDPWGNYDQARQQESQDQWANDPNNQYRESLSPSEQAAYDAALYGDSSMQEPTIDDEGNEYYEWDWRTAGCSGEAQNETYGDEMWSNDEFQPLMERMQTIYEQVTADPRRQEIDGTWATCMADAGFPGLTSPNDATEQFYAKLNELQNAFYSSMPEPTEEQMNDPSFQWPQFTMNSPEIAAEADAEIKQATADWECRDSLKYQEQQLKIQFEYEQKFIDENKAELEAFKAAQEQRQQ